MKRAISLASLIAILFCAGTAVAAVTQTVPTKITSLGFYNEFASGLVQIEVENPAAGCEGGFFMMSTDDGYQSVLSAVLAAYHSETPVAITGFDDNLQGGLGGNGPWCKLYFLAYK